MSNPLRVLQVFAEMNRGGAETMIMNLYRNIDRSKIQFDFIVHTEDKCAFDDEIYKLGGKIFRVPVYKGTNHLSYVKNWDHFFKIHPEYKIIHGHVRSTASIYMKTAKKYGLITIAHSHNTSSGTGFSAIAKSVLQYPIRYIADYLFACSMEAGKWLFGNQACMENNFYIINNAIDAKKFIINNDIRVRKRKEFQFDGKFVIGHIGRFHPQKNHEFLIDVFKEIHDKNDNAMLLLVGEGDLRESIQKKVYNLGLDNNVIFTGVRTDIPELLQAMDVFVFPSLFEGLPLTLVEAQASGLKCFVSDKISYDVKISELINFISLDNNPRYWAEKILEYDAINERENTYAEIMSSGYDINENAKKIQEFYIDVCKR